MKVRAIRFILGVICTLSALSTTARAQAAPGPVAALRGVPQFRADPTWPTLPSDFRWG
jgi:hypothetical protein